MGQLPCIPIASSVTSYGRDLLFQTKAFVEKHYTIDNGFPANAEVRSFGAGFAVLCCAPGCWKGEKKGRMGRAVLTILFPPKQNHHHQVVYGDTDSVMVNFGLPTVGEAMPLAERAAEEVRGLGATSRTRRLLACSPAMTQPLIIKHTHHTSGDQDLPQAHQAGVREGVLPVPPHEQEALRRPPLDAPGEVRQDGHQGPRDGTHRPTEPTRLVIATHPPI